MKRSMFVFRKRAFLNPVFTHETSYVLAHVESTNEGEFTWGSNLIVLADCHKRIELEFSIGTKRSRRIAIAKINLLIKILTAFRDALVREIALIEKAK